MAWRDRDAAHPYLQARVREFVRKLPARVPVGGIRSAIVDESNDASPSRSSLAACCGGGPTAAGIWRNSEQQQKYVRDRMEPDGLILHPGRGTGFFHFAARSDDMESSLPATNIAGPGSLKLRFWRMLMFPSARWLALQNERAARLFKAPCGAQ